MKYTYSQAKFSASEVAQFRLKVIQFCDRYGITAAKEAFGVSRATIFLWKQTLAQHQGRLSALLPQSTRPHQTRRMVVDPRILEFIGNLRQYNRRLGKEKIKVLLAGYCHQLGITPISASKVGRIIKRNNWFYGKPGRMYHNPSSGFARSHQRIKPRLAKAYQSHQPGDMLQLDTIVRFDVGIKRYIVTAIDLYSKFSFALAYKTLSSQATWDFYLKLKVVAPFKIKAVKTDNGLEFGGKFDAYLKQQGVDHYFSYPRTPQSNAFIERFNRTVQEEFIDAHLEFLPDTILFNRKLVDYLLYYNTVRPHQSLKYLTPMGYMLKEAPESNMYWTSTIA